MSYQDVTYANGVVVQRLDSAAGTATTFNPDGTVASSRALNAAEIAAFAARAALDASVSNQATLQTRAQAALAANTTFLALGATPTAAQVRDQTITLTKECTALIRLLLGQLDSTAGT